MIPWNYKNREAILDTEEVGGVPYLSFRALKKTGLVADGFSTRLGGVSKGDCAAMNFSYTRGDDPSDVLENFTRMAAALGVERDRMVVSWQTHTVHVRQMTEDDAGKGVIRPREYRDIDGMITDVPGLTLVTFYADCVPLYVVDPVHRAIGLSHAGWRGTVKGMARETLKAMKEAFGTRPEDLTVCIGPSICKDCFEVGEEVVEEFKNAFAPKWHDALFETGRGLRANISWISGRPTRSCFQRKGLKESRSTLPISVPCAITNFSSLTGRWEQREELWQRFCV